MLEAVKRRVDNELCFREPWLVKKGTEYVIEDGLGAIYSDYFCIGYIGYARYSRRVCFVLDEVYTVRYK